MKPVLIVQHVAAEGPGAIGVELAAVGLELDVRPVWVAAAEAGLPSTLADHSALVIMGGPMAAHSNAGFPTRGAELALAAAAVARGVPTLGVCLGAQLLAVAAGGRCFRGSGPEIGWYPIELTAAAADDALFEGVPRLLQVFHWHGDTFDLPAGAVLLAGSADYANQAFRLGPRAWGLQCHPEVDEATVAAMVAVGRQELLAAFGAGEGKARAARILAETPAALAGLAVAQRELFGRFAQLVVEGSTGLESH